MKENSFSKGTKKKKKVEDTDNTKNVKVISLYEVPHNMNKNSSYVSFFLCSVLT